MSITTLKRSCSRFILGISIVVAAASIALAADAKYVFLLIGDGMAMTQRSAAEIYQANRERSKEVPEVKPLYMNSLPAQDHTTYDRLLLPDSLRRNGHRHRYKPRRVIARWPVGATPYKSIAPGSRKGMKWVSSRRVSIEHAPRGLLRHRASRRTTTRSPCRSPKAALNTSPAAAS